MGVVSWRRGKRSRGERGKERGEKGEGKREKERGERKEKRGRRCVCVCVYGGGEREKIGGKRRISIFYSFDNAYSEGEGGKVEEKEEDVKMVTTREILKERVGEQ